MFWLLSKSDILYSLYLNHTRFILILLWKSSSWKWKSLCARRGIVYKCAPCSSLHLLWTWAVILFLCFGLVNITVQRHMEYFWHLKTCWIWEKQLLKICFFVCFVWLLIFPNKLHFNTLYQILATNCTAISRSHTC